MATRKPAGRSRKASRWPKSLFKKSRSPKVGRSADSTPPLRIEKMSEVLEEFVEPFRYPEHEGEDEFRALLVFGTIAWNVALLSEDERKEKLDEAYQEFGAELSQQSAALSREFLDVLVDWKLQNFAENRRLILSVELRDEGDSLRLKVLSTAPSN